MRAGSLPTLLHHPKGVSRFSPLGPIRQGYDIDVHELYSRDDGGTVYDKDDVEIIHWRQSHTEDGPRLTAWAGMGMCVSFAGDGRPNSLTINYAKGCDLLITEIQPEVVAIGAVVSGAMPLIARNTIDQAHNPAYAAGYLYNEVKPRMAMGTHVSYDDYVIPENHCRSTRALQRPLPFGELRTWSLLT